MKNELKDSERDNLRSLAEAIEEIKVCMVTTSDQGGNMCSRPMYVQELDEEGSLWFFTLNDSHLMEDVRRVPTVNVTFSDPEKNTYISATAVAYEAFERSKMEDLWSSSLESWFPQGLDTDKLTLLKLDMQEAEMWDSPRSSAFKVQGLMKLMIGEEHKPREHYEKIDLRQ